MAFVPQEVNWVRSGWGYRAGGVDDLQHAVARIGAYQLGRRFVWRGVSQANFPIASSLYRYAAARQDSAPTEDDVRGWELAFLKSARDWEIGAELDTYPTDLHILSQLQHAGAPTRLLDVTSNPQTALWFACAANLDTAGVLMAFDITVWPTVDTTDSLRNTWAGLRGESALDQALNQSRKASAPFVVVPKRISGRLAAQEGLFWSSTVPSASTTGFSGVTLGLAAKPPGAEALRRVFAPGHRERGRPGNLPFCAIVIPPAVKRTMLSHLGNTYNRRRSTLFPDVGGFVEAVRLEEVQPIKVATILGSLNASMTASAEAVSSESVIETT